MHYDRTYISEGINFNKINGSNECKTFHFNYFSRMNSNFQPNVCNSYYDFLQKATSFNKIVIVLVVENMYSIHFWATRKDEAKNTMKKVRSIQVEKEYQYKKQLTVNMKMKIIN